jgi:hypothetical protein
MRPRSHYYRLTGFNKRNMQDARQAEAAAWRELTLWITSLRSNGWFVKGRVPHPGVYPQLARLAAMLAGFFEGPKRCWPRHIPSTLRASITASKSAPPIIAEMFDLAWPR